MLRVEIFAFAFVAGLVPMANNTSLFRGPTAFERPSEFIWFSLALSLISAAVAIAINIVLYFGQERLHGPKPGAAFPDNRRQLTIVLSLCVLPSLVN